MAERRRRRKRKVIEEVWYRSGKQKEERGGTDVG